MHGKKRYEFTQTKSVGKATRHRKAHKATMYTTQPSMGNRLYENPKETKYPRGK